MVCEETDQPPTQCSRLAKVCVLLPSVLTCLCWCHCLEHLLEHYRITYCSLLFSVKGILSPLKRLVSQICENQLASSNLELLLFAYGWVKNYYNNVRRPLLSLFFTTLLVPGVPSISDNH